MLREGAGPRGSITGCGLRTGLHLARGAAAVRQPSGDLRDTEEESNNGVICGQGVFSSIDTSGAGFYAARGIDDSTQAGRHVHTGTPLRPCNARLTSFVTSLQVLRLDRGADEISRPADLGFGDESRVIEPNQELPDRFSNGLACGGEIF